MKDHEISELVNDLRDIAIKHRGTQQLCFQISRVVSESLTLTSDDDRHIGDKLAQALLRNAEYASENQRLRARVAALELTQNASATRHVNEA
ncbi:MAG: hypothetical protein WBR21_14980 [Rouxiella badensis]|uniref:hypothetical protein n=1 Tax=Rouxiella badensis TaxID=1646377 RepID=UPI003C5467E3